MADADVDGAHIRTLLLTLFFRYMPQIIENGYLYAAQPPLYRVQVGKDITYCYSEREMKDIQSKADGKKVDVQRYKGLGEMNAEQLWETTLNPDTRRLLPIMLSATDLVQTQLVMTQLMGKGEAAARRELMELHGDAVEVDI